MNRHKIILGIVLLLMQALPATGFADNLKAQLAGCTKIVTIGPKTTLKDSGAYLCSIQISIRGQSQPKIYLGKGSNKSEACNNALKKIKEDLCP